MTYHFHWWSSSSKFFIIIITIMILFSKIIKSVWCKKNYCHKWWILSGFFSERISSKIPEKHGYFDQIKRCKTKFQWTKNPNEDKIFVNNICKSNNHHQQPRKLKKAVNLCVRKRIIFFCLFFSGGWNK